MKQYFHIGDIATFITGRAIGFVGTKTAPDGAAVNHRYPADTIHQMTKFLYEEEVLMTFSSYARFDNTVKILKAQFPEITQYCSNDKVQSSLTKKLKGTQTQEEAICISTSFVNEMSTLFGEWHLVNSVGAPGVSLSQELASLCPNAVVVTVALGNITPDITPEG